MANFKVKQITIYSFDSIGNGVDECKLTLKNPITLQSAKDQPLGDILHQVISELLRTKLYIPNERAHLLHAITGTVKQKSVSRLLTLKGPSNDTGTARTEA